MSEPGLTAIPRLVAKAVLKRDAVREVDLLLLPERVVRLNTSGAAILRLCDGSRTVHQMVVELEKDFEVTELAGDVLTFLHEAHAHGWVVVT